MLKVLLNQLWATCGDDVDKLVINNSSTFHKPALGDNAAKTGTRIEGTPPHSSNFASTEFHQLFVACLCLLAQKKQTRGCQNKFVDCECIVRAKATISHRDAWSSLSCVSRVFRSWLTVRT